MEERRGLIWLYELGVRGRKAEELYSTYGSYGKIFKDRRRWQAGLGDIIYSEKLRAYNQQDGPEKLCELYIKNNIEVVTKTDTDYPDEWLEIEGMPPVVYIKGNKQLLKEKGAAIVGSRNASLWAMRNVDKVVEIFVGKDIPIVSGLARGIDSLAHIKTLERGGRAVAVLAHGLDSIYPKENEGLAKAIIDRGGMLIGEVPIGETIEKYYFLLRNRIIVGLAGAVVVVEAQEKSGTVATAHWALEMGRELYCMSGSPGCEMLIAEGARRLTM